MDRNFLELVERINPNVINDDGTFKSFKEQLLEYEYGYFDATKRFVISEETPASLLNMDVDDVPLTMKPSTYKKIVDKHETVDRKSLAEIKDLISDSCILGMDSYTRPDNAKVMYLNEKGNSDIPLFVALNVNVKDKNVDINEIASIYERKNIEYTIKKTYASGLNLYVNENTKDCLGLHGMQFPAQLNESFAVSNYTTIAREGGQLFYDDYVRQFGQKLTDYLVFEKSDLSHSEIVSNINQTPDEWVLREDIQEEINRNLGCDILDDYRYLRNANAEIDEINLSQEYSNTRDFIQLGGDEIPVDSVSNIEKSQSRKGGNNRGVAAKSGVKNKSSSVTFENSMANKHEEDYMKRDSRSELAAAKAEAKRRANEQKQERVQNRGYGIR